MCVIVWSALTRIFQGLVWAVGCILPRASTLRMRLAVTTSLCGRLTADDDCFSRCAACGSKCLVLNMPLRSRTKLVAHVVCSGSTDCVWVVSALAGSLRGLSWAYLLQFRQLCPSSSETRCATCLSANYGGVALLSWLIHVATARVELPTLLLCTESHVVVVYCSLQTMGCS